jgi:hypothetical protein
MEITTVGLDIAKRVFQLHGVDAAGKTVLRRKLQRSEVLAFFKALSPCLVGIEACGTAHYWAREIRELGHEVRLMPPSYVAPYVKRGKTDAADAAAICEAVTRPTMRSVPIKTAEQQSRIDVAPNARLVGAAKDDAGERPTWAHGRVRRHRASGHSARGGPGSRAVRRGYDERAGAGPPGASRVGRGT